MPRNSGLFSSSVCAHSLSLCAAVSHLKATLLDVVKLQAERLYAAYDSPLVTNQADPDAPDAADAPSSRRKLLCTLWCLLVSQTSLCVALLCRLSSLSVWLLIIQRQTDLRSSAAAAAKEKQERWRSSIRATGRTHEIRRTTFGRIA